MARDIDIEFELREQIPFNSRDRGHGGVRQAKINTGRQVDDLAGLFVATAKREGFSKRDMERLFLKWRKRGGGSWSNYP